MLMKCTPRPGLSIIHWKQDNHFNLVFFYFILFKVIQKWVVVLSPPAAKKVNAKIDQKLQLHWVNPLLFKISESFFNKRAKFVVINCQMYVLNQATKMVDKSWAKNKDAGMHTK